MINNSFISALEDRFNYKFTENMGVALKSTGSKVYDLFAFGGAYRYRNESDCILLFKNAFDEDAELAMKCLFYLRDIRGGQGERRFFRVCYHWLAQAGGKYLTAAASNLNHIPMYGRWDDLFCLFDTPLEKDMLELIKHQLTIDMSCEKNGISLLAKWMPSENTSSYETRKKAKRIREYLNISPKEYRKMLSKLRGKINVLEKLMSANQWHMIEFDKIPSRAGLIYRNAFARRDIIAKQYEAFIKDENTKVNADAYYIHYLPWGIIGTIKTGGQYSPDNISYVEQYQIGGISSVRGYSESLLMAPSAYYTSLEMLFPIPFLPETINVPFSKNDDTFRLRDSVKFAAFLDHGGIFPHEGKAHRTNFLLSDGIGIRVALNKYLSARFYVGFPLMNKGTYHESDTSFHFDLIAVPF